MEQTHPTHPRGPRWSEQILAQQAFLHSILFSQVDVLCHSDYIICISSTVCRDAG